MRHTRLINNLSEAYNGMDQFMREVMRVANTFEDWACAHVSFNELNDVWPYLLETNFGEACLKVKPTTALAEFNEKDCLRVALRLRLPVRFEDNLPIPIRVTAKNPVEGSAFREFSIQTFRDSIEDEESEPFTIDDDPFDENFGPPYFSVCGMDKDGRLEHVADRPSYSEAVALVMKFAPGIDIPIHPSS